MDAAPQRMDLTDWSLIAALSVIWGGAFYFIEIILRDVPPNTMVLARLAFAIPPLLLWLAVRKVHLPRDPASWRAFFVLGALNIAIPFILFAYAQVHISASIASILNATTPLWGVLTAHLLTSDEKATRSRIIGVLIGFSGVVTMIGTSDSQSGQILPQLACVAATLMYGLATIYARKMGGSGLSSLQIATGQLIAAALLMLPYAGLTEQPWTLPLPSTEAIVALLALAIISTSLAYLLYFRLIERAGAQNPLLITFLIPVTAILLGTALLGDSINLQQCAGIALIFIGLLVLDGRLRLARAQ